MTMGERIKSLRKAKGLSQENLAEELGVSRQSVSKWELGEALPETEKLLLISNYFQVSLDYLMGKSEQESQQFSNAQSQQHSNQPSWVSNIPIGRRRRGYTIGEIIDFIKSKGYIGGYIISAYALVLLIMSRISNMSFKSIMMPEGWDIKLSDLPIHRQMSLYITDGLSVVAVGFIIFGIILAIKLKKKYKE